jgi:serine-type D-Ala-D-Ala carboxypeptidase (penicillin-binding protein 5/6)
MNKHRNNIIRGLTLVMTVFMIMTLSPIYADDGADSYSPPEIQYAQAAYLYNFENDCVLLDYNSSTKVYPASTVKIMTAIVAFDVFGDNLDREITVTQSMLDEVNGNKIGFQAGEVITVRQALSCMLVNSANDAAIILAHAAAGSTEEFVSLMNQKASEIGAYDTYYTNPTGMHNDAMVTTAKDTATISIYAYAIPGLIDMTSTPKYVMSETNLSDYRNIYNRNSLLSNYYNAGYYYTGTLGLNAGATTQGGYSISAIAEDAENGLTYLAVVLGAEENDSGIYSYKNAIEMFDWAFDAYGYRTVLSNDKMVCELPVNLSSTLDYVTLIPSENITVYLPMSINLDKEIRYSYNTYEESLDAPVSGGQEVGTITVLYGDKILGSCSLITTSSVTRSEFLYFLARVKNFTDSRLFHGTIAGIIFFSVAYILINAAAREKKLRRSYKSYKSYRSYRKK